MRFQALIFAAALFLAACGHKEKPVEKVEAAKPQPVEVKVVSVGTVNVDQYITATGSLSADETVSISSEVPGRVQDLNADFGAFVKRGQTLVQLDTRELQISLERSRAGLNQALARIGLDPNQVNARPESSPAVRLARAQYEDAKSKYDRARKLVASGDIAEERAVESEKLFRAREAAYEQAKDELRTALASIDSLRAEVRLAEKRVSDATVKAPFDGFVTERTIAPGQFVKENTSMMTIVKARPLRLRVEVPQDASGVIRNGSTLLFTTDAAPDKEFQATVSRLDAALNPQSRSLQVEARVSDPDQRLRPGLFVSVRMVGRKNVAVPVVDKSAVISIAGLNKIYVIENNKAVERRVPPGDLHGNQMQLPAEIPPGTLVATSNLNRLANEAEVRVQR